MSDDSTSDLKTEISKLQKELHFTRTLLESANSIVIRWYANGIIHEMNDFGLHFFGYSSEELIGQHITKVVPKIEKSSGRDMSGLAKDIAKHPDQYKSVPSENITKDGRTVWVTWTNKGILDEQGNVQEILAIGNDITALKEAERKHLEYQEKLDAALESMDDAVLISDSQGNLVHLNEAFATFHKFKNKAECTDQIAAYPEVLDVFLPDGTPAPLEQWAIPRALRGEFATDFEYSLRRKDTGEAWVGSYNFGPFFDPLGNILGAVMVARDITERKRAEKLLQASEAKLKRAQEVGHVGSWDWDIPSNKSFWSEEMYRIYGVDPESELTLEMISGLIAPEDLWKQQQAITEALAGHPIEKFDYRIIRPDGVERIVEITGIQTDFDKDGKALKMYGVAQDITERKQAEVRLLNEKAFLRSLIDSVEEAIYFKDKNGLYQGCNKAAEKFLKTTESKLIGKSDFDIFSRELAEHIVDCDQKVLTNGETVRIEERINVPGAPPCIMETVKAPIYDADAQKTGLVGVSRDITEKKLTEEALRKSNKDLRLAQRIANIGNWTLDPAVGVPEWTEEVYRIYERDPELGPYSLADYKEIYIGEWFEIFTSAIQSAIREGQPYDIELKLELGPDKVKWVQAICEPEQTAGSKGYSLRGTIQDITGRKQAEQERQELESLLRQKYKMEAVGVMAGGMAHNFNNNLAIILGNLELSKVKLPPESEVGEYLEYARIASLRSRDLVKQIMTYSRKDVQNQAPLQLTLLLKETFSLLKSTIPSSVKLSQEVSPDCENTYILADASQIQECILNLCNNAVHAMNEQGELLLKLQRVELKRTDIAPHYNCSPGEYLCLSVQDNGCGIPVEIQEKIFDPFFTTKELYEGTGMGLSSVQGIVEQHHGMITVKSSVGRETLFNLYFPVVDQPEKEGSAIAGALLPRGSERILFVDDDPMIANLNERVLSELGYQVTIITDSVEALKLFSTNIDNFDLIITDQTMPELTGNELIQKIKKLRPEIPTILCTGFSSKINEEEARQAGISAFLMKPTDFSELSQTIRNVLSKPSAL